MPSKNESLNKTNPSMQSSSQFLLTLGGILLLGLVTSTLGRRSFLPRVTLLLIFGAIIGKEMLDVIPSGFYEYPFHAIEGIEWPFLVVFFVLAGASLELNAIREIGIIGAVYILCRAIGKLLGARLGSQFSGASQTTKNWMGMALLPQAGVAIGMALVASNHFPEYRQVLLPVVIGSTVFFEIVGPVFTRLALKHAQDA